MHCFSKPCKWSTLLYQLLKIPFYGLKEEPVQSNILMFHFGFLKELWKIYDKAIKNLKHLVVGYMLTVENLENTVIEKKIKTHDPSIFIIFNSYKIICFKDVLYSVCTTSPLLDIEFSGFSLFYKHYCDRHLSTEILVVYRFNHVPKIDSQGEITGSMGRSVTTALDKLLP